MVQKIIQINENNDCIDKWVYVVIDVLFFLLVINVC